MRITKIQWILGIFAIIIIVGGIAIFSQKKSQSTQYPSTTVTKNYTDSKNYFTVTIPPSWTTKENIATQTQGLNTPHPTTRNIQITQLYSDQGVGVTIQVYEGKPSCPIIDKPNTKLGGLPAVYNDSRKEWTVFTTSAMVVVRYSYPGTGIYHRLFRITPTQVPTALMDNYQRMFKEIMASFHLNNMQPLSC